MSIYKLRPNYGPSVSNIDIGAVYPILYRFMEERYIDEFLNEGKLQISTMPFCRKYEDAQRSDCSEAYYGYVFCDGEESWSLTARVAENAFVLCSSLTQCAFHEPSITHCLEIREADQLAREIADKLKEAGYDVCEMLAGPCNYSMKGRVIDLTGSDESIRSLFMKSVWPNKLIPDADKIACVLSKLGKGALYFTKPFCFMREHEFRLLWLCREAVNVDHVVVTIDNPERFGCKVQSGNFVFED